ncbi:MAG: hypothetical protein AVDCRST_MAG01-01-2520, partial [uncultured Rubrobacteraceae bacterium]
AREGGEVRAVRLDGSAVRGGRGHLRRRRLQRPRAVHQHRGRGPRRGLRLGPGLLAHPRGGAKGRTRPRSAHRTPLAAV